MSSTAKDYQALMRDRLIESRLGMQAATAVLAQGRINSQLALNLLKEV